MNREVERLFHELADLAPEQRASILRERGIAPAIRAEVELLLHFDAAGDEALAAPVAGFAEELLRGSAEANDRHCGPYRLLHLIGSGGMGAVYLAERTDGEVEQRVAVKCLRAAGGSGAFLSRFLRERQILATLRHPGIASLLDAGHSADGQPYLVMDYIDGVPIDTYAAGLEVREKVALFIKVCEAVSYAHGRLIVHRDIKPSNILVDASGQPKLLDFGIAKLLDEDGSSDTLTLLTREGDGALTPAYAAPEQVSGGPITTATDVYALGVLLFVLLTGEHPAGPATASYAELVRAVIETVPPRLSTVVAATTHRLDRLSRADLDTIVAKTLKKDPQERYDSAAALAEDLSRTLRNQPIRARPDTVSYRLGKFVRRRRAAVALGALALIATVAGIVGTVTQASAARRQRDFALRQLARADAINALNVYLLSDAAPSGKPFTVNDLLRRAERVVQAQHGGDLGTRVELLISIGRQYTVQDEYGSARGLLEKAQSLAMTLPEASVRVRAACALAQALSRSGNSSRAEALFQEAARTPLEDPLFLPDRVSCLLLGSEIAQNLGNARDGIERARQARLLIAQSPTRSELQEVDAAVILASAYSSAGQLADACSTFEQAAARLSALGRDDTQRAATIFNNWGNALYKIGRPLEAERAFRRAIDAGRDGQGEAAVSPLLLINYGRVLRELERLDEAADYTERGHSRAVEASDRMAINQSLILLSSIYRGTGDLAKSNRMLDDAEARVRHELPAGHIAFAVLASLRSLNAASSGDAARALTLANDAVAIGQAVIQAGREGANYLGTFLVRRSELLCAAGRSREAAADAQEALALFRRDVPVDSYSANAGRAYLALGRALQIEGRQDEARQAFRSAVDQLQRSFGPEHPETRAAAQRLTSPPLPDPSSRTARH